MLRYSCLTTGILLTFFVILTLFACRLGGFPMGPGELPTNGIQMESQFER